MEDMKSKSWKSIIIKLSTYILVGILFFLLGKYNLNSEYILNSPYPYTTSIKDHTSLSCKSILYGDIISSPEEYYVDGIKGTLNKGTDTIAISLENPDTLKLITGASVSSGITEGDDFFILHNDDNTILAVWSSSTTLQTITLNKDTGLGIWQKNNSNFPIYNGPYGSTSFIECH